jgi:uncharacterized protein
VRAAVEKGYAVLARTWAPGDVVTLDLPMPVRRVIADERVAETRGKVALERGPIVYAAEGVDNNGSVLDLRIPEGAPFEAERRSDMLGDVTVLTGLVTDEAGRARRFTAIPYYAWAHRGAGEMVVWCRAGDECRGSSMRSRMRQRPGACGV